MHALVGQWASDSQFLPMLAIVATQIALLVLSAGILTRLNSITGTCKHRIWIGVTVLLFSLLPSYLIAPSWLATRLSIPIAFDVLEVEVIDEKFGQAATVNSFAQQAERRSSIAPTFERTSLDAVAAGSIPTKDDNGLQNGQHDVNASGIQGNAINAPARPAVMYDGQTVSRIETIETDYVAANKPLVDETLAAKHSQRVFVMVAVIYFVVCSYLLSRLGVGWWRLYQMRLGGKPLDESSLEIARHASKVLRLRCVPKLLSSSSVPTPMSWGIFSPTVLVPDSFASWSPNCRKAVLMHELSHVARRDAFYDLMARLCSLIYWFHPAVYFLGRAVANSREEATDERVIGSGLSPTIYARQLLEVAERCKLVDNRACLPAVSMASCSTIETRVRRILQRNHQHLLSWPRWRTALFLLSVAGLVLFSIPLRLSPSDSATLVAQDKSTKERATTLFERVQSMAIATTSENSRPMTISGVVRNSELIPTEAVVFCLSIKDSSAQLIGRTATDTLGRYSLTLTPSESQRKHLSLYTVDSLNRITGDSSFLFTNANSEALQNVSFALNENTGRVEGELLAPGSQPMSGIKVKVLFFSTPTTNHYACRVDTEPFQFKAISDESGHFVIDGLPADLHAVVTIESDTWDSIVAIVGTSRDTPTVKGNYSKTTNYFAVAAQIKLYPKCDLNGVVVDTEGAPVAGVRIGYQREAITDADGKYTIRRLDPNAWGEDELMDYGEGVGVEPPSDSRFSETYFNLDREQLSSRTIRPVVLQGTWVSGRILSAKSKQPLADIEIRSEKQRGSDPPTSDADGRFRIALQPDQKSLRFAPNWMSNEERQQFQNDPKSRAVRLVDVIDNEPVDLGTILLDVDTEAAKPVTIRVVTIDGKPVSGCKVVLSQYRPSEQARTTRIDQASLVLGNSVEQLVTTDAHGIAVIKPAMGWSVTEPDPRFPPNIRQGGGPRQNLAANTVTVSYPIESPRYFANIAITKDIPEEVVELRLAEGALYSGKVLLNGSPLYGAGVNLGVGISSGSGTAAQILPGTPLQAYTNEQGEYSIYAPAGNLYTIDGLRNFPIRSWGISTNGPRPTATDDPLKFVFADIELASGARKIAGTVVDPQGKPIKGANLSFKRNSQILVYQSANFTGEDGQFISTGLPEGLLILNVRTRSNGSANVELADKQTEIEVVMPR